MHETRTSSIRHDDTCLKISQVGLKVHIYAAGSSDRKITNDGQGLFEYIR